MHIIMNGRGQDLSDGATVRTLLDMLALNPQATVVERNGDVLDRAAYAVTILAEGDTLEIVRFVGGG